ncbi:MAG: T9SS type A sorting domain-containing protein, partial [Chitinophagaceae bacterium]
AFDGAGSGATYGYANILPKTAGDFYTGLQNSAATWAGPFQLVRATDALASTFSAGQFLEVSINLTKLGIEPGNIYGNYCGTPFRRVLIKSRSSTSFTSELKDFIAPFKMFDYPVEAYSFVHYFCETMPLTPLTVSNPNPNFNYIWQTTDGNIIGSNIGDSITVDAPGTYYVLQQKHQQCLPDATDSITIFFDSVCMVLNLEIRDLEARVHGNKHLLKWTASNNQLATGFELEYSLNGIQFMHLAHIDPRPEGGNTHYSFENPILINTTKTIYYRIKIISSARNVSYSNLAIIKNDEKETNAGSPLLYPNPGSGNFKISYYNNDNAYTKFDVFDTYGRKIRQGTVLFEQGMNNAELTQLSGLAKGAYILVLYMKENPLSIKFVVDK